MPTVLRTDDRKVRVEVGRSDRGFAVTLLRNDDRLSRVIIVGIEMDWRWRWLDLVYFEREPKGFHDVLNMGVKGKEGSK